MRSSGLSIQRIALPVVMVAFLICLLTFFWNEGLVPIFAHRASVIYKVEIKNRQQQSLFGTTDIWIRGEGSFINVDHFDVNSRALEGVTVLQLNRDFSLRGMFQIPSVHWTGKQWESKEGTEWHFAPEGQLTSETVVATPPVTETPDDLKLLARDAEEFSFRSAETDRRYAKQRDRHQKLQRRSSDEARNAVYLPTDGSSRDSLRRKEANRRRRSQVSESQSSSGSAIGCLRHFAFLLATAGLSPQPLPRGSRLRSFR